MQIQNMKYQYLHTGKDIITKTGNMKCWCGCEETELSYSAGKSIKLYTHFGKEFVCF